MDEIGKLRTYRKTSRCPEKIYLAKDMANVSLNIENQSGQH
jgi:hypothetical protein